ncbi:MAG: AMP-binding protein [Rubrivivax sp.]
MNLFTALRAAFPADLSRVAIETADTPAPLAYTWGDLERGSAMLANLLASLALPPRSRVAMQVDKSVEALMLYLAVLRTGHVVLPLNTAYQEAEIAYFIGNAEPAVVVCSKRNFGRVARTAFNAGTKHVYTLDDDRSGTLLDRAAFHADRHEPRRGRRPRRDPLHQRHHRPQQGRDAHARQPARQRAGAARGVGWAEVNRAGGHDVLVHALPIFHVHGLFVAIHAALLSGSRMVWFNRFDPRGVAQRLREATVFMGVPTLYVRLLGEPALTREQCARMRLFISGSAPLLIETFEAWQQRTGHTILERYGMSETVMLTSNPYRPESARRGGTVGPALPGVGVRVRDDKGTALPAGEIGGIEVKGPSVFKGYWRMPEKTAEEFTADGWFKTGDVGRIDADGYVTIVGRSKDLIISGGYNVYPAEIEGFINEMPGVAESALVGVPHPDFGEVGVAAIVARPGAALDGEAILATLKARIANFKVPKRVFVVADLPRNAMGKVQKNLLREQHKGLFGG